MEALCAKFMQDYARQRNKLSTQEGYQSVIDRNIIPLLGRKKVYEVKRPDIAGLMEKLEKHTAEVKFAVVLATPDDEGYRTGHEDEKAFRARQNVVMELGMMLTRLGRKNVAILIKEQEKMEKPSDIQGLIYIPLKDNLQKDAGQLLAKEMLAQGYPISLENL